MSDVSPTAPLSAERRRTLEAMVQRILPGTRGPGAAETGVAVAVETALQHRAWRASRPWIERTLDQLQARAGARDGCEFCACTPDAQDDLLRTLERDPNPVLRQVFRCFVVLSLEGLLGDPRHGGNRDFRAWKAMGLQIGHVRSGMCRGAWETDGCA
jgi:hypothetical protein